MSIITGVHGEPLKEDYRELRPDGQQKQYAVLSAEERAKGFVRPVRRTYVHAGINPKFDGTLLDSTGEGGCGTPTTMGVALAETYARDPKFYTGTFCVNCGAHFPLAQFVWAGTTEIVGS